MTRVPVYLHGYDVVSGSARLVSVIVPRCIINELLTSGAICRTPPTPRTHLPRGHTPAGQWYQFTSLPRSPVHGSSGKVIPVCKHGVSLLHEAAVTHSTGPFSKPTYFVRKSRILRKTVIQCTL